MAEDWQYYKIPSGWHKVTATPESTCHSARYRAIASGMEIKVYNGAGSISVKNAVSFDIMNPLFSAVDLIAAALLSEVLLCIRDGFARCGEDLADLEGRVRLDIANPLAAAGVRGVDGLPSIERIEMDIYLFTFLEEKEARALIDEALRRAVCYHTLQRAFPVSLRLSFAE